MTDSKKYLGKFRGSVAENVDPLGKGRIRVVVADVSGRQTSGWAMPCLAGAGPGSGCFTMPQVGAGVWVEFEQGNPDYPIWAGGYWGGSSELPAAAGAGPSGKPPIVLQTGGKNSLVISDAPGSDGGLLLTAAGGAKIMVNDTGITIDNGKGAKIVLQGNAVTVNDGALRVM